MARIKIPVRLRKTRRGFKGTLTIQLDDGGTAAVTAFGKSPAGSVMKAAALAQSMAKNPIFQAVAPPGTAAAIKAVGLLARGFKRGKVDQVLKKFAGRGAKRLIKKFKFW